MLSAAPPERQHDAVLVLGLFGDLLQDLPGGGYECIWSVLVNCIQQIRCPAAVTIPQWTSGLCFIAPLALPVRVFARMRLDASNQYHTAAAYTLHTAPRWARRPRLPHLNPPKTFSCHLTPTPRPPAFYSSCHAPCAPRRAVWRSRGWR